MQPESGTNDFLPSVDYTHVLSASASFKDLVTVAQENSTHQSEDVLWRGARTPQTAELSVGHLFRE